MNHLIRCLGSEFLMVDMDEQMGGIRFSAAARAHEGRSVKENVTSSKTSASLLRTSSGSDWKEGTLGGERSDPAG